MLKKLLKRAKNTVFKKACFGENKYTANPIGKSKNKLMTTFLVDVSNHEKSAENHFFEKSKEIVKFSPLREIFPAVPTNSNPK